ncbi:MAG: F0F1 ATP synthase subunit epsilon [Candidatus Nitrosocaldus sp.]
MARIYLEIVTPDRVLVRDEVDIVEAPGTLGEFGVLPGHIQFFTTLEIGEIRYQKDGKTRYIACGGGFAEVYGDRVTMLLDVGECAEDIDIERAKRAEARAREALKDIPLDSKEYKLLEAALLRAITRISVAQKA